MFVENEIYKINICKDETFTVDSADNKPYDLVFNPSNMDRSDYYKTLSICIDVNGSQKHLALIGSLYAGDEDIAVLKDKDLIVLMNTMLTVIDCNALTIKSCKTISDFGVYFSLHKFDDGYVVYGELDIIKLSAELETDWSFSGADIFVTLDGRCSFYIEDDTICLIDWNGTEYKIDKYGNEL